MAKKNKLIKPKKRQRPFISFPGNPINRTIKTQPRIAAVCTAYNISDETLIDFLDPNGFRMLHSNSLLDSYDLKLIDQQFQLDKIAKDVVRGNTTLQFINANDTKNTNSGNERNRKEFGNSHYREQVLHLKSDLFDKPKQQVYFKSYPAISSNFTDNEAINICSKMSSSFTRALCRQLCNHNLNRELTLYQIHYIANEARKIFGGKILTFIHSLRNLHFKNQTAKEIKAYAKVVPDFPIISFNTGSTVFKISFFVKPSKIKNKFKADIRLFAPKTHKLIGHIDEEGYVLAKLGAFKPQLNLFYQSTKDNSFEIFSGVETGNCEICGHGLSHPLSLRIGIGPICAKSSGVDRVLYNFD